MMKLLSLKNTLSVHDLSACQRPQLTDVELRLTEVGELVKVTSIGRRTGKGIHVFLVLKPLLFFF